MNQGGRDEHLLTHPLGKGLERRVDVARESEELEVAIDALRQRLRLDVAQAADKLEIFNGAEIAVEFGFLRDVADYLLVGECR